MVYVSFLSLAGVVLGLTDALSHEGFTVFNPSKGEQVSPKTHEPQSQALWVVAFARR